jgi:hypothetical protein
MVFTKSVGEPAECSLLIAATSQVVARRYILIFAATVARVKSFPGTKHE